MGKIQEYSRNWLQRINRMPRDITGNIKALQTNRQKRPGESIKETSGYVRPERVDRWPNCMMKMNKYVELYSGVIRCKFTTSYKTESEQLVHKSTTKPITESNPDPINDEALYHYLIP